MIEEDKFILFDCMETLIDLRKLPNLSDYAGWGFYGSGAEELWEDFDGYFRSYLLAKAELSARLPENTDYEMRDRFFQTVRLSFPDMDFGRADEVTDKIYTNYWRNYRAQAYVREDVGEALPALAASFRLGVVSNFMVMGGIEELLELHGLLGYFEFVVTSVAEGFRKPHPTIYKKALDKIGAFDGDIVFVGDDYVNDYETPLELGMKPVFLDRFDRHPEVGSRVRDFYQLRERLGAG